MARTAPDITTMYAAASPANVPARWASHDVRDMGRARTACSRPLSISGATAPLASSTAMKAARNCTA
jgi:hypothetical protein